ncbi:MAG: hypothetical protein MK101_10360 [Phycisphaerales bacterium]|nr:hypothetical protein [Phycisphaerales bacterium]
MPTQLLAIARNTFFESIRQPITLVVVAGAALLIVMSNPLAAFTMGEDQRMLIDIGLATVFTGGAVLAAFIATGVLGREIAQKTALTVISKPVSRTVFLVGKFIGVSCALLLTVLCLSLVFMLTEMHSVIQTVRDPVHVPVLIFGFGALIVGLAVAVWCNYFYGMVFTSTTLFVVTPLLLIAWLLALNFKADFSPQPMSRQFNGQLWLAVAGIAMAECMLAAFAIAFSTRLGQLMTLLATLATLMIGLLSDWLFARPLQRLEAQWLDRARAAGDVETIDVTTIMNRVGEDPEQIIRPVEVATMSLTSFAQGWELLPWFLLKAAYGLVPNFQVLWLSDALTQGVLIPGEYLLSALGYGLLYTLVALALGIMLFQRRELG